jgi:hypothetical protein
MSRSAKTRKEILLGVGIVGVANWAPVSIEYVATCTSQ